jgi:hypothetical protein
MIGAQLPLIWHLEICDPLNVKLSEQWNVNTESIGYFDDLLIDKDSIYPLKIVWGSSHVIAKYYLFQILKNFRKTYVHISVVQVAIEMQYILKSMNHVIENHLDRYIELFHLLFDPVELFHYEKLMEVIHIFFLKSKTW